MTPSRNSGPKRRARKYAQDHQISLQQAQRALGFTGQPNRALDGYTLTIGTSVRITAHPDDDYFANYTLSGQETAWTPFSTRTGPCVLIDTAAPTMIGALAYQAATHPDHPLTDILMIGPIQDPEHYEEISWMMTDPAINFQHFTISNEDVGYAAAAPAALALTAFHPRGTGVVILDIVDPYDQVTQKVNEQDFEDYRGTQWESHFRPRELTEGPFWSENISFGEAVNHVLSAREQKDYEGLLSEVSRLLDRAAHDGIIVLLSGSDDFERTVARFPLGRFGTRLSGAVRVGYHGRPQLHSAEVAETMMGEMFPGYESLLSADPDPDVFWWGLKPDSSRLVLARLNRRQTAELLLLVDPPAIDEYWTPSYSALRRHYIG